MIQAGYSVRNKKHMLPNLFARNVLPRVFEAHLIDAFDGSAGESPRTHLSEINYFSVGRSARNVRLASVPEAYETQAANRSDTAPAQEPLEVGTCNGLVLLRCTDIRQPFWRQSMSKMSEYFKIGGVRGMLLHLQPESANSDSLPVNFPGPRAPQGLIKTERNEPECTMPGELVSLFRNVKRYAAMHRCERWGNVNRLLI
jgi:hypothetical protein